MTDTKPRSRPSATKKSSTKKPTLKVVVENQPVYDTLIIGSGFGGLGAAIRLRDQGVSNIVILERFAEVGGTWRDNQYPGAACDIPSNLYSFSFAPNPEWSRTYSGSGEILGYVHHLVDAYNLKSLIRFNQTVNNLRFDETRGIWEISTAEGDSWQARSIISAAGGLANPSYPNINGRDDFSGKVIHSARWDHEYDFTNKRVAVIGTGASAIQIIPELVKKAGFVKVFQRTPAWVMPRADFASPDWSKNLFRKAPRTQQVVRDALFWSHESMALAVIWKSPLTRIAERIGRAHLERQVPDPWMRRQLTPNYRIGCKRVLVSNDYYPALQADNCKLITWPIDRISENGVRTVEGIEHQFDCIVYATGFEVSKNGTPFPVTGINDRNLNDEWQGGAQAFKSINVSGYPNLHFILGPNSGPGHNSALVYMESQIGYAVQGIKALLDNNYKALDVIPSLQEQHNAELQKRLAKTSWNSGCKSWYLSADGYNATMYPGFATQYANMLQTFDLNDYQAAR